MKGCRMGELVGYGAHGQPRFGYLAGPAGGTGPGIVVLQEWWGLVDANGRVFVCDRTNSRIQVFDARGKFLDQWKGPQIGRPYSVAVAAPGRHVRTTTWSP